MFSSDRKATQIVSIALRTRRRALGFDKAKAPPRGYFDRANWLAASAVVAIPRSFLFAISPERWPPMMRRADHEVVDGRLASLVRVAESASAWEEEPGISGMRLGSGSMRKSNAKHEPAKD